MALNEVGEVEWGTEDENAAREGVPRSQLRVFRSFHDELLVAEVTKGATAIGFP